LPAPAGRRPVLLLSRSDAYEYLSKFIVAEISTTIRSIPVEVRLHRREGLKSPCVANLDNVRTVALAWLEYSGMHWLGMN
jgi:mRNA interferase MazF